MDTPFAMVYRVSGLTYFMGKSQVKVPHFAMVNLIAGERIVPELVQQDFTAANVAAELSKILPDGPARERMLRGLAGVRASLRGHTSTDVPAAERAATAILEILKGEPAAGN